MHGHWAIDMEEYELKTAYFSIARKNENKMNTSSLWERKGHSATRLCSDTVETGAEVHSILIYMCCR